MLGVLGLGLVLMLVLVSFVGGLGIVLERMELVGWLVGGFVVSVRRALDCCS